MRITQVITFIAIAISGVVSAPNQATPEDIILNNCSNINIGTCTSTVTTTVTTTVTVYTSLFRLATPQATLARKSN